jgi:hypothetical protein
MAPTVVGLVGDRPIEPVASEHPTAVDSAALPVAAPAAEQTRFSAIQHPAASVSAPGVGVQRSMNAATTSAASWPSPAPQPVAVAPTPPELRTELVVQRADDTTEPAAAATNATATTAHAAATIPAPSAGSTSPTEVDTLVRRLYDPIIRRLKAELQLDRERAGQSLDLRH